MKDKKLQIFISSTYHDLIDERQAAVEAILSSGHIPAGMELFSAGDESQMQVIERWINESDIYLLILGGRYGSVDPKTGKSYTQLEYEYALGQNKPLFAIVVSEKALNKKVKKNGTAVIETTHNKELTAFRALVLNNLVKFWEDSKDIKIAIHETISEMSYRKNLTGWIRAENGVNSALLAEEIARLTKENGELRLQLSSTEKVDRALYAGLTYEQLQQLLQRNTIDLHGIGKFNLLHFLILQGKKILNKDLFHSPEKETLKLLVEYKILNENKAHSKMSRFEFTEDGHNFYLKALLLAPSQYLI